MSTDSQVDKADKNDLSFMALLRIWTTIVDMGQDSGVIRHSNWSGSFPLLPLAPRVRKADLDFWPVRILRLLYFPTLPFLVAGV
jgi:hypothetical protein